MTAQRILDVNEAAGHTRPQLVSDMHFREQFYGYFEGQDMGVAWTAAGGPHGAKNYNDIVASSVLVRPATSLRKRIHSTMPSPTWNIGRESRRDSR